MGIFNQQPNYTQSTQKENEELLALKDLLARLARLVLRVTKVQNVIRVFKDPKVIRVFKDPKVIKDLKVLDLVLRQGGIIVC